jgi:redox-sensitive bicupin YhaK (pirin superfamily)
MWIHQDAWFHLGEFDQETHIKYSIHKPGNGIYVFMIEGDASVSDQPLSKRDALGLWETESLSITAKKNSRILLLEVPMQQ